VTSDPLHCNIEVRREWTTTNFSEAMPGVPTPLTWSVWHRGMELGAQRGFVRLGLLPRSRLAHDLPAHLRISAIFYGHVAGNVSLFREITAAMPGTSPAAFDEQIFGMVRPDTDNTPNYRRYPIVVTRAPITLARLPRQLRAVRAEAGNIWATTTSQPIRDCDEGRRALARGAELFTRVLVPHSLINLLAPALFQQLGVLATQAGRPGLERQLATGSESMEELHVANDLWAAARGTATLDDVLVLHGYHGPAEGELSAWSWRENPDPLLRVFAAYQQMPNEDSPNAKRQQLALIRRDAENYLAARLTRLGCLRARILIPLARRVLAAREVGKTAFVQALDVARHGARGLGQFLCDDGVLARPDDVFYFTLEELMAPELPSDAKALVEQRRAIRADYRDVLLPDIWWGQPKPLTTDADRPTEHPGIITGLPAASGIAEGVARVILDPAAAEPIEAGEILVCATTDPSWVGVMVCAAGLVIDVGGAVSHGAIIAREMRVPCVINTKIGTSSIRTGDRIRMNGDTGSVEILELANRLSCHTPSPKK
jgi:pyruvate,water dikinase